MRLWKFTEEGLQPFERNDGEKVPDWMLNTEAA